MRTATAAEYTYLDCPRCGRDITQPFAVTSGPIPFVHHTSGPSCRLIIWPDPDEANHRAWEVPHDTSLEEATTAVVMFAQDNGWRLGGIGTTKALATVA